MVSARFDHLRHGGVLLLASLVLGCGPAGPTKYPVSGTVRYQGKPLTLGTVTFVPASGPVCGPAAIGPDGGYQLEATAGQHAVGVVAMPPRTGGRPDPHAEGGVDWTGVPAPKSLIPEKYNRYDTSGVTVMVEAKASNSVDIDLK
jgi:hypothetical protein